MRAMNRTEARRVREALGLSLGDLSRWLKLSPANGPRLVRDWEDGRRPITGPASVAIEAFDDGFRPAHVRAAVKAAP